MRLTLMTLTLVALGACTGGPDKDVAAVNNVAEETEAPDNALNFVERVGELSERERNAVFFRAIRDAGLPCQDVPKSEQIEAARGTVTWRAQCEDRAWHLLQVTPDGTINVISRTTG